MEFRNSKRKADRWRRTAAVTAASATAGYRRMQIVLIVIKRPGNVDFPGMLEYSIGRFLGDIDAICNVLLR